MKHIVFLASGNGGNLKFFYWAQKKNIISGIRLSVVADRECGSIDFARRNGLEHYIINYKRSDAKELTDILERINPDIIVTNWHKIIDEGTVRAFKGKFVNLHYSLLPAFGGLIGIEPISRAYAQGCKFIGPTCHLVDEGVDTGMILSQAIFKTDIQIDDAIGEMFRKGCLVLLIGVQQLLGEKIVAHPAFDADTHDSLSWGYAPSPDFDVSNFSEIFWQELATS
jgi:phosphoribosylglycinamide formyltransferase-1